MQNRHLISKQTFELSIGHELGFEHTLQESFSNQYWQSIVPAFENLFDRLAGPDELLRVDRLELDLGRWTEDDILSGRFIEQLLLQLESKITETLNSSGNNFNRISVMLGSFNHWIYFLEYGYLPTYVNKPESQEEWQQQILDCLTTQFDSRLCLRNLLLRRPQALKRLLLQHDEPFLKQLLEVFSGRNQQELTKLLDELVDATIKSIVDFSNQIIAVETASPNHQKNLANSLFCLLVPFLDAEFGKKEKNELNKRIHKALKKHTESPEVLVKWLTRKSTWKDLLKELVQEKKVSKLSKEVAQTLQQIAKQLMQSSKNIVDIVPLKRNFLRQLKLSLWRVLISEIVVKRSQTDSSALITQVFNSTDLSSWRGLLDRVIDERKESSANDASWNKIAETISDLQLESTSFKKSNSKITEIEEVLSNINASNQEDSGIESVEEGNIFYVQSAGVVLLHPFLKRFFENLNLYQQGEFADDACRQRAVCLIHYLATGEVGTPEYQLVLPKFLCGMPLNAPLDHFIEISNEEQSEGENLLRAAIEHWDALGNSSPDWLREMFIQRDGKLERRDTGWHLQVERKVQDILLSKLPQGWGVGIVKLPWMDEMLSVDWS